MNFDVFDFHDEFTLHEVVCLCIGRDPAAGEPAAGDADLSAYAAVKAGAEKSVDFAIRKCAQANMTGAKQLSLPRGQLYPEWVLFYVAGGPLDDPGMPPKSYEYWGRVRRDQPKANTFSRATVAAWLEGRQFRPVYDFGRPGGSVRLQPAGAAEAPSLDSTARWPWGTHETELLRHLSAAAQRWWSNFDPTDHTTAPTNQQVADWLQAKPRNVGKVMAEKMATILRPEGLPTGPRA